MKKSELKEIIKAEFLTEKKDSKKGNEDEQKRMEGAIRDDRDHIKNLKKDIEANEKKLAKLKKDYKKDVVKENSINEEPVSAAIVAAGVASVFGGSILLDKLMSKAEDGDFGKKGEEIAAYLRQAGSNAAGVTQQREEMKDDKDDMDEMMRGSAYEEDDTMREEEDMDEMMRGGSVYDEDDTMREQEDVDVDVDEKEDINVDVEKDVDVDDVSKESDIEVKSELPGESSDVSAILGLLTKAQERATDMGDEKLMDQIGNTITYYTRAHVVAEEEKDDMGHTMSEEEEDMRNEEMSDKDEKVKKEELNEEVARFKKLAGLI